MSLANNTNELNIIGSHIAYMKEEYGTQSGLIAQIKTVLQQKASGEVPPSKLAGFIDGSLTEITAQDLDGATEIRGHCFYNTNLTKIDMPNTITRIGSNGLAYNYKLTSLRLSDNLTSIGYYGIYSCSGLTDLTIPASVTGCGNASLQIGSSTNKATIRFLRTTPPSISSDTFTKSYIEKIIVPKGCLSVYLEKTNWANFAEFIVESET